MVQSLTPTIAGKDESALDGVPVLSCQNGVQLSKGVGTMSVISASSTRGSRNRFLERVLLFAKASIGFLFLALLVTMSAACNVDLPVFSDLKIEPSRVKVGEEVTISARVTIERDQRIDVRLYIDGTLVETQSEFINPSRIFSFKRIENTPGTYHVDIEGLTGSYTVDPLPSPAQSPATYTITASSDTHGSISPVGALTVNSGSSQTFVISADVGYQVNKVMVDGVPVGALASYSFTNVTANHVISASFANIVLPTATATTSTPSPTPTLPPVSTDLSNWTAEAYDPLIDEYYGPASWSLSSDHQSVNEVQNCQAAFYYSSFNTMNRSIHVKVKPLLGAEPDDDFIGFALGFKPGDTKNHNANFLLIDWKASIAGESLSKDFVSSCGPGGLAQVGLAVSRVTGIPNADEFWQHVDQDVPCSPKGEGLAELDRATNLGDKSWEFNKEYDFTFEFDGTSLRVYVDKSLELEVKGSFRDGRLAFFNFSEAEVIYGISQ
jgi:hypothetical protein